MQDKKDKTKTKNKKGGKPKSEKDNKPKEGGGEKEAKAKMVKDAKKAWGLSLRWFLLMRLFIPTIFRCQANNDASNKLKWAIGLMPALDAMPET